MFVKYPIHVGRDNYRGADARKRLKTAEHNSAAMALEQSINAMLLEQKTPIRSYGYDEISNRTGYSITLVAKLCYSIASGSNGFTAIRKDLTYEQAMNENAN